MSSGFCPTTKDILGTIEMLRTNNNLARWSAVTNSGFNEISKQAFNCQISVVLFEYAKHYGFHVDETLLPRIALYRGFEKNLKCDITSEAYEHLLSSETLKKNFEIYFSSEMENKTSPELRDYIFGLENSPEMFLFKAATAIATYLELQSIKPICPNRTFKEISKRQAKRLQQFFVLPEVRYIRKKNNKLRTLFEDLYNLRNRVRWIRQVPLVKYNVLGHSLDVALLNYLLCLADNPENTEEAYQAFAVGLFHDVAENWTGDMPSPIKDGVPGLRKKTEEYENQVLENEVFKRLPKWIHQRMRTFMLEMLPDEKRKKFKTGDQLAAIIEVASQLLAGSTEVYFKKALKHESERCIGSEICAEVIRKIVDSALNE